MLTGPLADFPAVFFHISFGICHGTQQAVVTAYRVYQNVWTSISGRNERFGPFSLQNIHVWCMKGELESAWYAKELKIPSWEAIFTTLGALAPHIEDEPRNEEQHCKNHHFSNAAWYWLSKSNQKLIFYWNRKKCNIIWYSWHDNCGFLLQQNTASANPMCVCLPTQKLQENFRILVDSKSGNQEGATVGFGTLEATRLSFSAQTGASQEAHYGGGGGEGQWRRWSRSDVSVDCVMSISRKKKKRLWLNTRNIYIFQYFSKKTFWQCVETYCCEYQIKKSKIQNVFGLFLKIFPSKISFILLYSVTN